MYINEDADTSNGMFEKSITIYYYVIHGTRIRLKKMVSFLVSFLVCNVSLVRRLAKDSLSLLH